MRNNLEQITNMKEGGIVFLLIKTVNRDTTDWVSEEPRDRDQQLCEQFFEMDNCFL